MKKEKLEVTKMSLLNLSTYLGLFCPVALTLPLVFGVVFGLMAGDPFEQLIVFGLAGLFGLIYALYSLVVVEFNLLAIVTFPFVGLVTCWWLYLIGVLFRDGVTFCIGLSLRSGDFNDDIEAVPLLTLLLIDSDDPFDAALDEPFAICVVGPTYLTLVLCANRGDNVEFVLVVMFELFWIWVDVVGVEVFDLTDVFWFVGDSCAETGDVCSFVGSFGR